MDIGTIINNIIDIMKKYWRVFLLEGIPTTLELTAIAVLLGALLGAVVTMLKRSRFRIVRFLVSVYVEVIRGTPILLQLNNLQIFCIWHPTRCSYHRSQDNGCPYCL